MIPEALLDWHRTGFAPNICMDALRQQQGRTGMAQVIEAHARRLLLNYGAVLRLLVFQVGDVQFARCESQSVPAKPEFDLVYCCHDTSLVACLRQRLSSN